MIQLKSKASRLAQPENRLSICATAPMEPLSERLLKLAQPENMPYSAAPSLISYPSHSKLTKLLLENRPASLKIPSIFKPLSLKCAAAYSLNI